MYSNLLDDIESMCMTCGHWIDDCSCPVCTECFSIGDAECSVNGGEGCINNKLEED